MVGLGLSLRPTPHRFTFDGRTVYGWCATDTPAFPVILGRAGVIESTCPATGRPIRVGVTREGVTNVDPSGAVVSLVRPDQTGNIRDACNLGRFYASREAAAGWLAAHPEGWVQSVDDDFQLHRELIKTRKWGHAANW